MAKRLFLPTLLLVTNNPSIRHWIKKHLDDQFFILEAKEAPQVMEAIRTSPLDLILLDTELEGVLDLCKEMRKALYRTLTPILLITGRLKKSFREKALEAGVTDFLSNQLDLEELQMRIAAAKRAQELREKTSGLSQSRLKKKEHD